MKKGTSKIASKKIMEFLRESNNIESEYRDIALEDAVKAWEYLSSKNELTLETLIELHRIHSQRIDLPIAGKLRTCDIWIAGRPGAPWELVPGLLNEWLRVHGKSDTAETIKAAHIAYEKVHPWRDQNGRTGRQILNWQRLKAGLPILVIRGWKQGENEYHPEQKKYYEWFD